MKSKDIFKYINFFSKNNINMNNITRDEFEKWYKIYENAYEILQRYRYSNKFYWQEDIYRDVVRKFTSNCNCGCIWPGKEKNTKCIFYNNSGIKCSLLKLINVDYTYTENITQIFSTLREILATANDFITMAENYEKH